MPKPRKVNRRKVRSRVLILCEGAKTEPIYFMGIKADKEREHQLTGLRIEIFDTLYNTGRELVKQAALLKKEAVADQNPYDSVWVVVDLDGYSKHPQAFQMANQHGINLIFSAISFEYWFLLHFGKFNIPFKRSKQVESYLREKEFYRSYKKNFQHYDQLKARTYKAIENAQWLREELNCQPETPYYKYNPFTNVDVLVSYLLSL